MGIALIRKGKRPFPFGRCAFDFETTGLYPYDGSRAFLAGMEDQAGNVLLARPGTAEWRAVQAIVEDPLIEKLSHGSKFELKHAWHLGWTPRGRFHDTMAKAVLVNEYQRVGLGPLAAAHLNDDTKGIAEDWLKKNTRIIRKEAKREPNYSDIPDWLIDKYLEGDLDKTLRLDAKWSWVEKQFASLYKMETDLAWDLASMEDHGLHLDMPYVRAKIAELRPKMDQVLHALWQLAGVRFNPASHEELCSVLESLGLDTGVRTKEGNMRTRFEDLAAMPSHPFIDQLVLWRGLSKIVGTYLVPFSQKVCGDVLHGSFWQFGQDDAIVTGRLSSSDPNLQNLPGGGRSKNKVLVELGPMVRKAVVPPPGHALLFFDYKQIEMLVFSCYAGDERLIEDIRKGLDVYVAHGKLMLGPNAFDGLDKVAFKRKRFEAKELCLSFIYGMGLRSFAKKVGLSFAEARQRRNSYFANSPRVKAFMMEATRDLLINNFVEDVFKRRYHVPRDRAYKAVNAVCQGSAATVMKKGIIRMRELAAIGVRPIMTIHDELICVVPLDRAKEAAEEGKRLMRDADSFPVPLEVDAKWSDANWAEKREFA